MPLDADISALDDIIRRAEDERRRRSGGYTMPTVGGSGSQAGSMPMTGPESGDRSDRPTGIVPLAQRGDSGDDSASIMGTIGDAAGAVGDAVGDAVDWAGDNLEAPSLSDVILGDDENLPDDVQMGIASPGGLGGAARGAAGAAARSGSGLLSRIGSSRAAQGVARQSGLVGTGQKAGRVGGALGRFGKRVANPPSQGGRLARNIGIGAGGLMGYGALFGDEEAVDQANQGSQTLADRLGQGGGGGQQEAAMPEGRMGGPPSSRAGPSGSLQSGDDGLTALDGIIRDLEGQSQQVEEDFQAQREQLRDQFSMSETPEEQAQLAFMLEDLEARRDAAQGAIATEYGRAQDAVRGVAAETRQRAETAGQPIEQRYQQGAQAARQGQQEVRQDYADSGVGVGAADPDTSVESTANMMEQRALSEGDFAEAQTNIAASDSAWLADTLAAEEPAQQGALQRQVSMQQGQAQREHAQQVNQRIAQDRRTLAQLESQLTNQQHTRQGSILDRAAQLQMQQEQLEQRQQEFQTEQGGSSAIGSDSDAMSGNFPQNLVGNPELQTQVMFGLQMEGQTGAMRSLIEGGFIDEGVAQTFQGAVTGGAGNQ